jgi:PAS domain S-box-containing protein
MTITEDTPLRVAVQILKEKKWSILPITNEDGSLVGVFTSSGMYQMILDKQPINTPISDYIKKDVSTIHSDISYDELERIVQKSQVGTGVVLDEQNKVLGLLTKSDMVMALLKSSNSLRDQLQIILQHTNMGTMMTNEVGEILYVNERLCKMLSMSEDQLIGRKLDDIFPVLKGKLTDEAATFQKKLEKVKAVLHVTPYQMTLNKRGFIILFQDLSEIELMAEELQTVKNLKSSLETAMNHAYDGILMTDENQKIQMVSPSLLELFNMQKNDVIEKQVDLVFPQFHLSSVYKSETGEFSDFLEINGIKYIVHRIPILQDGKVIGVIGKVMYRQLNEVSEMFKKLQKAENKASYYQNELKQAESARFTWDHIISLDPYMEKLKKSANKAAKGRSTILIRGESGTGKELFAHAIHNSSPRKNGKFVVVNCAAIPEDLLESEFFGYEEGAFTGAKRRGKLGKFDLANGGTLFLDEIGDMSLSLQAKLLRVLQEREFYRVGGSKRIQIDVRIIAATNRYLEDMVKKGQFREDLYYRLNVISLNIPPLKERRKDIDYLIKAFTKDLNKLLGTSIIGMDERARDALLSYDWPGNVRELRNVMERAMTFAENGKIHVEDLSDYILKIIQTQNTNSNSSLSLVEDAEITTIEKALIQTKGNKAKAARLLGISRSGLYEKLKKYELNV